MHWRHCDTISVCSCCCVVAPPGLDDWCMTVCSQQSKMTCLTVTSLLKGDADVMKLHTSPVLSMFALSDGIRSLNLVLWAWARDSVSAARKHVLQNLGSVRFPRQSSCKKRWHHPKPELMLCCLHFLAEFIGFGFAFCMS